MHFNSQPHKEADTFQLSQVHTQWYFNSQPHKEADVASFRLASLSGLFQLTASQGG